MNCWSEECAISPLFHRALRYKSRRLSRCLKPKGYHRTSDCRQLRLMDLWNRHGLLTRENLSTVGFQELSRRIAIVFCGLRSNTHGIKLQFPLCEIETLLSPFQAGWRIDAHSPHGREENNNDQEQRSEDPEHTCIRAEVQNQGARRRHVCKEPDCRCRSSWLE